MPNTLKNIIAGEMKVRQIAQKDIQTRTNGKVKQGNLSAALKGTRHFTLEMLDSITAALDLPFGHFYPYYTSECKDVDGNRLRNKCKDFIIKCNEIGQPQLTEKLVNEMIQEGPANVDVFFGIADELVKMGMNKEAVKFYDIVIELDNDKLSERLANAMYKRYCIVRDWSMEYAYDSTIQLTGYLHNITIDKLEAFRKVVACFFVLEKWEKVVHYSEEMASIAKLENNLIHYGNAQLYKLRALYYLKQYAQAIEAADEVISLLGKENNEFKIWGEGNRYNSMIACGKVEVIDEFADWLSENPGEIPAYIHCILDVCIKQNLIEKAVSVMGRFQNVMSQFEEKSDKDPFKRRLLARYQLMTSKIMFATQMQEAAIDTSLKAMQVFAELGLPTYILSCVKDLHTHKEFCTEAQNRLFSSLLDVAIAKTT